MRRRLLAAALVVAGLLALAPGSAGAASITPTLGFLTDNFTDNSKCSLREAVQIANTNSAAVEDACAVSGGLGADTIKLGKGTYVLQREEDGTPNDNVEGDLDVTGGALLIDGVGAGTTKIDAAGLVSPSRVLHTINSDKLTVQELTVTGGHDAFGGGISVGLTAGSLRLVSAAVNGNFAAGSTGGGIYSNGTLTVEDSDVTGNSAATGAGIVATGPATVIKKASLIQHNFAAGLSGGGGILASGSGTLAVEGSTVDDNHATGGFGGGISIGDSVGATVTNSHVTGNTAEIPRGGGGIRNAGTLTVNGNSEIAGNNAGFGGGIHSEAGAVLQITGPVSLHHNSTTAGAGPANGGAILSSGPTSIDGATLEDNDAAQSGGAVYFDGAAPSQLSISNSTIRRNFAAEDAGAILTDGQTSIAESVISSNGTNSPDDADTESHDGGAIFALADTTVSDSTISANAAATGDPDDGLRGGGIVAAGDLTVRRSTLSSNVLLGGDPASRDGAGIYVLSGIARLENATVNGNSAPGSGGVGGALYTLPDTTAIVLQSTLASNATSTAPGINSFGTTKLVRSIIDQGATGCVAAGAEGTFMANSRNLDAGISCVGAANDSDLETTAAMLGGLAMNGGPTRTRALLPGSPAIDVTPVAACTGLDKQPLTTDQRGFPRPRPPGGACDVGAFEVQ